MYIRILPSLTLDAFLQFLSSRCTRRAGRLSAVCGKQSPRPRNPVYLQRHVCYEKQREKRKIKHHSRKNIKYRGRQTLPRTLTEEEVLALRRRLVYKSRRAGIGGGLGISRELDKDNIKEVVRRNSHANFQRNQHDRESDRRLRKRFLGGRARGYQRRW
jgi:hypothetical protein